MGYKLHYVEKQCAVGLPDEVACSRALEVHARHSTTLAQAVSEGIKAGWSNTQQGKRVAVDICKQRCFRCSDYGGSCQHVIMAGPAMFDLLVMHWDIVGSPILLDKVSCCFVIGLEALQKRQTSTRTDTAAGTLLHTRPGMSWPVEKIPHWQSNGALTCST